MPALATIHRSIARTQRRDFIRQEVEHRQPRDYYREGGPQKFSTQEVERRLGAPAPAVMMPENLVVSTQRVDMPTVTIEPGEGLTEAQKAVVANTVDALIGANLKHAFAPEDGSGLLNSSLVAEVPATGDEPNIGDISRFNSKTITITGDAADEAKRQEQLAKRRERDRVRRAAAKAMEAL